jgi:hypothetical protein
MRTVFKARFKIRQHAHILRPVKREAYAPVRNNASDIAKPLRGIVAQIPGRPQFSRDGAAARQIEARFSRERGYNVTAGVFIARGTLKAVRARSSRKRFMAGPPPTLDLCLKA